MKGAKLIEIDEFLPEIEPELAQCPTPVLEGLIRRAIIESCERANIWLYETPEILTNPQLYIYELLTPTSDTLVHSVLDVCVNGRPLHKNQWSVPRRGLIELHNSPPDTSTVRSSTAPIIPDDPVEPTEPVDPDPPVEPVDPDLLVEPWVGFGANELVLVEPNGPWEFVISGGNNVIDAPDSASQPADIELHILDFTNFDFSYSSNFMDYGYYIGDNFNRHSSYGPMSKANAQANVLAGRPFILTAKNGNNFLPYSEFVADISELPKFIQRIFPYPYNDLDPIDWQFSSPTGRISSERTVRYNGMISVPEWTFFQLNVLPNAVSEANNGNVYLEAIHATTGDSVAYDVVWDVEFGYRSFSDVEDPDRRWENASQQVFIMAKQAVPNGERGIVIFRRFNNSSLPNVTRLPQYILDMYDTDEPVTTEVAAANQVIMDAYNLELQQYQTALQAHQQAIQSALDQYQLALQQYQDALQQREQAVLEIQANAASDNRTTTGIVANVTIKPSINTLWVDEIFLRDYYKLIFHGALAKGFKMNKRPWTDIDLAKENEKLYELELAKAKQGVDRNFHTSSQRIKPRRFTV